MKKRTRPKTLVEQLAQKRQEYEELSSCQKVLYLTSTLQGNFEPGGSEGSWFLWKQEFWKLNSESYTDRELKKEIDKLKDYARRRFGINFGN